MSLPTPATVEQAPNVRQTNSNVKYFILLLLDIVMWVSLWALLKDTVHMFFCFLNSIKFCDDDLVFDFGCVDNLPHFYSTGED